MRPPRRPWRGLRAVPVGLVLTALVVVGCSSSSGTSAPGPASAGPTAAAAATTPPQPSAPASAASSAAPVASAAAAAGLTSLTLQATISGFTGALGVLATANAVWILDHGSATLTRVDPATNHVTATVTLGPGNASGLGLAGGRIWTFHQTAGEILGIDPATAKIVSKVKLGQDGDFFAVGDGAAWLLTGDQLTRIDAGTGKVTSHKRDASCSSDGFAVEGGFAWLARADGSLCKVDETSGAVLGHGTGLGNGSGLTVVDGHPWMAGADGGLSIVDPTALTVQTAVPAPASAAYQGANYTLGSPGGENTVVVGDPGGKVGWLRFTGATVGQVTLGGTPAIRLLGLFPSSSLAGGVVAAFGSLWVTNFDGGTVERYALPTP